MQHPPDPSALIQTLGFQILSRLRDIAGSVRISLFQLFMCVFLIYAYTVPGQANDIFVGLSRGDLFQFIRFISSIILASYLNWYMAHVIYVKLALHNRLPDYYSESFYRNIIHPVVTLIPFVAAIAGFYFSVTRNHPWSYMIAIAAVAVVWYLLLFSLEKKGVSPSLKKMMEHEETELRGLKWYKTIIVLFLALFASSVLLPQHWGWTRTLGPIVIITLGFCFWTWVGSFVYLYSRIWYTPFIPIGLTYVFLFTEPFNNNHSIRTVEYDTDKRLTIREHLQKWLQEKYELRKDDALPVNIFIVAAEGGGIRSAYWTSGVLAWLENKTDNHFHEHIIATSSVSGGSVGMAFFANGLNTLLQHGDPEELNEKLKQVSAFDYLSDLNAGLIFNEVIQKAVPLPINALDRAQKLEDAFSQSFENHFGEKLSIRRGLCAMYGDYKQAFNPCMIFNTTHVESGRKAIVSNCRIGLKNKYFHDVIDVLQKSGMDVPITCAASMSARFPFVTPPALIERKNGDSWGHVVDGGYFENSGLHSTWQLYMELSSVIKDEIRKGPSEQFNYFLQRISVKVVYLKNSLTSEQEDLPVMKYEELAPADAFINAWGRKTVTDIKHFENNLGDGSFFLIRLKRAKNDGIPLGWYLSEAACKSISDQLNNLDSIPEVQELLKVLSVSK